MKVWTTKVASAAMLLLLIGVANAFMSAPPPTVAFGVGVGVGGRRHALQTVASPPSKAAGLSMSASSYSSSSSSSSSCSAPEKVLLVGPSLLQLVVAKHLKARGIDSLIVCPNNKMEQFKSFVKNGLDAQADAAAEDVISRALYGLPEESDPPGFGWREGITAVVVCAEDAIIGQGVVDTVMRWDGYGADRSVAVDGPSKAILCVPLTTKVNKEKSMNWVPIFNNDKNEQKIWSSLVDDWNSNDYVTGKKGSVDAVVVRFGSLFGGSVDGPAQLEPLGLNERVYKMSLEQYRDLRERAFDRFRLGAQILLGDDVNRKPSSQEELEKKSVKGEVKEAFQNSGEYPEQDRTNRHTLAAAVVEALCRPVRGRFTADPPEGSVPEQFTVLSKSVSALPTDDEWDALFNNPGPAAWPDPTNFVMPEPVENK